MTRLNFLFRSWGWIGNNQIFCMFFHESYRFKASWGDDKYGFIVGCGEFSGVRWVEWRVRWLDCLTSSWLITKVKYTCPRPGVMDWYPHWYTGSNPAHQKYPAVPKNLYDCLVGMFGLCLTDAGGQMGECYQHSYDLLTPK